MMRFRNLFFILLCCWQYVSAQEGDNIIVVPPGSTVNLHASSEGASSYQWFRDGEAVDNATGETYAATLEGKYTVVSFNTGGCGSETSNMIEIRFSEDPPPAGENDLSVSKEVDNPRPVVDDLVTFTIRVDNADSVTVRDIIISDRLPSGYTYGSHQADKGTYNVSAGTWNIPLLSGGESAKLQVSAKVLSVGDYINVAYLASSDPEDTDNTNNRAEAATEPLCLTVYNLFSPNGDGMNDTFHIDCIENYPDNTLKVYNRYGNLVFKQKGYDNTWKGDSNVKNTIARNGMLPVGTYYYILDLGDGNKPVSGWLYIMR